MNAQQNMLKTRSTRSLCEMYEALNDDRTETVPMVRGWIMGELESRDEDSFNRWIDSDYLKDMDYPSRFFC